MGEFHWWDVPVGLAYGWSLLLQVWVCWRLGRWPHAAAWKRRMEGQ